MAGSVKQVTPSEGGAARASAYSVLAALLARPPQAELLARLSQPSPAAASESATPLNQAWLELQQTTLSYSPDAIAEEFHDLFIGLGRGELVPNGSWYITGFLMEEPLAELRHDLGIMGFESVEHVHEPEDHVAALCETMSLMAADDGEFDCATQQKFYQKHIEPWMTKFFHDLTEAEGARFYVAVGRFGEQFLSVESQYFSMGV